MKVAFIGLGTMGGPMARRLIEAGHALAAYDVSPAALRSLGSCRIASCAEDAARDAEVVMTMLPDASHVREALFGKQGACNALEQGSLVVEMSTIAASASAAIAGELRSRGFRMLDAPVGRTPRDAAAGTLLVMAGGSAADLAEARPLLECFADTIVHAGPQGHGIRMKLVNNYMAMVGAVMTAETLTLAAKAGLDRQLTVEVLRNTTAGRGHINTTFPRKVLAGDIEPDFPMRMAVKDVTHALSLADEVGCPLRLGAPTRDVFALAAPRGRGDQDWTAVLLLMEDLCNAMHPA